MSDNHTDTPQGEETSRLTDILYGLADKRKAQVEKMRLAKEREKKAKIDYLVAEIERVRAQYPKEVAHVMHDISERAEQSAEEGRRSFPVRLIVKDPRKPTSFFSRGEQEPNPLVQKWRDITKVVRALLIAAGYAVYSTTRPTISFEAILSGHEDFAIEGTEVVRWDICIDPQAK